MTYRPGKDLYTYNAFMPVLPDAYKHKQKCIMHYKYTVGYCIYLMQINNTTSNSRQYILETPIVDPTLVAHVSKNV